MATITTELIDTGAKRDEQGRRIVTPAERVALLAGYRRSGMTQKAFAQREGVKYSTFTAWLQGRRRAGRPRRKARFAEVALPAPAAWAGLAVQLPDGLIVRGTSAREVAELVQALRG